EDVHQERLALGPEHQRIGQDGLEVAILNSKGFGGNNASAVVLSPHRTETMLETRYGAEAMAIYRNKREASLAASQAYIERADKGDYAPIYRFGEAQISESDIEISQTSVAINGLANKIQLPTHNPYVDMMD
ncbi:MAG: beta-ketoacyl synthase, partial [Pseudomonadota bacterium]